MVDASFGVKLLAEAFGTGMLVITIACSVALGSELAPLAIGLALTVSIFLLDAFVDAIGDYQLLIDVFFSDFANVRKYIDAHISKETQSSIA